ncbi:metallophosphoesterase [Pseudarthrobacter sp. AB1]|uniref:metallophosphoesterase family protein n=1 Tax=Pseudarthrobacter sp. AB1 TaxID=2138309 RepID=UPI00186B9A73|nr:metallophosphoesterase [Pseudarthrobacter sp. AB1]
MSETSGSGLLGVVGDWHGNQQWAVTAIRSAARENVTTLIHVGDFGLDWPGARRGRYEQKLNRALAEHGIMMVVSPGNHDNLSRIGQLDVEEDGLITWRSNIKVLPKGGRTVISGLRIGGLGGAYSVDQAWRTEGKDWWPDEEPTVEQAERLVADGPVDILITHDAPAGVPVRSGLDLPADVVAGADRTRILLREVADQLKPPLLFCGHWHQRETHDLEHPDGRVTRVDVLDMENSREGNGVLVWPGSTPLRVEPLFIRGNP